MTNKKELESIGVVFVKEEIYDKVAKDFVTWEQATIPLQHNMRLEITIDKALVFELIVSGVTYPINIESLVQFQNLVKGLKG